MADRPGTKSLAQTHLAPIYETVAGSLKGFERAFASPHHCHPPAGYEPMPQADDTSAVDFGQTYDCPECGCRWRLPATSTV